MTISPDCEQITSELNELKLKIAKMKARRNAQMDLLQRNLVGSTSQLGTYSQTKPRTYYNRLYSNNQLLYPHAYPWRSSSLDSLLVDKYYESPLQRYKHLDDMTERLKGSTDSNLHSSGLLSKLKDFVFEQEREVTNDLLRRIAQSRATTYDRYSYRSRTPDSSRSHQPVLSLAKKQPPFLNPINKKDNFYKRYNAFMKKILKPTSGKSKSTDDYAVDYALKYRYNSPLKYRNDGELYYDPYYKWPRWYRYSSPFIRNRFSRYWHDYDDDYFDYDYKTKPTPAVVPRDVEEIIRAKLKYDPAVELQTKDRPFFPAVPSKYDYYDPYKSDSYLRSGLPNWKQYYYTQKLKSKPSHLRFLDDYYDPYLDFFPDDASVAATAADERRRSLLNDADDELLPDEAEKLVDRYRDAIYEDIIRNLRKKQLRKSHSTRSPAAVTFDDRKRNDSGTRNDTPLLFDKYESDREILTANLKPGPINLEERKSQNGAHLTSNTYTSPRRLQNAYSSSADYVTATQNRQSGIADSVPSEKFTTTSYKTSQQPSRYYSTMQPPENQNAVTRTSFPSATSGQPMTIEQGEPTKFRSATNDATPVDTLAASNKNVATKLPESSYSASTLLNVDSGSRTHYMPHQTAVDYSAPTSTETSYISNEMSAARETSPSRYAALRHEPQFFSATRLSTSQSPERSKVNDGSLADDYSRQSPLKAEVDATKYKSQNSDKWSHLSRSAYSNIDNQSGSQRRFNESPNRQYERTVLSSPSPPPTSQSAQNRTDHSPVRLPASQSTEYADVTFSAPSASRSGESTYIRSSSLKRDNQFTPQTQPTVASAHPSLSQEELTDLEPRNLLRKRRSTSSFSKETTDEQLLPQPTEERPVLAPRKQSSSSIHEFERPFSRHSSVTKLIADDQSPKRSTTRSSLDEFPRRASAKEFDKDILFEAATASADREVVGTPSSRDGTAVEPTSAAHTRQPLPLSRRNSYKPLLRKASLQSTNSELQISNATKPVEPYSIEEEPNATIDDTTTTPLPNQTEFDTQAVFNVENSETRPQNLEPYHDDGAYYDQDAYHQDYMTYDPHGQYLDQTDTGQTGHVDYYRDGNYNSAYGDQAYGSYGPGYYDQNLAAYADDPTTIYAEQSNSQYAGQDYAQQDYVDGYPSVLMSNEPRDVDYSLASVDKNNSESLNDESTSNREQDVTVDTTTQDANVTDNTRTVVTKSVNRRNSTVSKPLVRKGSKVPSTEEKKSLSKTSSQAAELQKRTSKPKVVESRFRRAASTVKNNARASAKKT